MSRYYSVLTTLIGTFFALQTTATYGAEPPQPDFEIAYTRSLERLNQYRKTAFLQGLEEDDTTVAAITQAYELGQQTSTDPLRLAELAANYGNVVKTLAEAETHLKYAIRQIDEYSVQHEPSEAWIKPLVSIGHLNYVFSEWTGAVKYYRQAFRLADKYWKGEKRLADLYMEAGVYLSAGNIQTAKKYLDEALKIYSVLLDKEGMATVNMNIGRYYYRRGQYLKAEQYLNAGLAALGDGATQSASFIGLHTQFVKIYAAMHKHELAGKHSQIIGATYAGTTSDALTLLHSAAPKVPYNASRLRESGEVTVRFTVNELGEVINPVVTNRTGHYEYEAASLEAIQFFRYAPRFQDGKAIATPDVEMKFAFRMND